MKTKKLNLLILDDNLAVAGPLTKYLNKRFGERINLSIFIDGNECMRKIDHHSHVLILNYAMKGEDLGAQNRGDLFRRMKRQNPQAEVTMLTSKQHVSHATGEIQRRVGNYIRKKEKYLYHTLLLLDKAVLAPIHTGIVLPVTKIARDFKIWGYILLILAAFTSVGISVIAIYQIMKLLNQS